MNRSRKIRWGVVSTARIAVDKVIPGVQKSELCEVVAIASRDGQKARAAAEKLGIRDAHGSYQELFANPDVDVIYNPLPNHLHVPISIQALEAGKHVLCEKPIAPTSTEGQQLVDAARQHPQLKVMEAFMYRHHPQWQRAREIVRSGGVGELRTIQTLFSYFNDDPDDIRNDPAIGGGGLLDIGCYPVSLSRFLFEGEPARICGAVEYDPRFGTDRLASAILEFPQGTSTFTCSTQLVPYQRVNICGTTGRVEIEIPFNAPPDRPCRLWHQTPDGIEEISIPTCDQYGIQGDVFARCILEDTPVPTPIEDAVTNMQVIETIVASAKAETWLTFPAAL